ncbi:hypothetical protein Bca4012_043425 [Brassica carinata]|uniref:Uncharacterized protein n=1 Tax=Brassica carinata TaxID=52824 RepID=A0A8X7QTL9_BRACI|nr:hypothetical protein Bca52824_058908 [Brassica carinata]
MERLMVVTRTARPKPALRDRTEQSGRDGTNINSDDLDAEETARDGNCGGHGQTRRRQTGLQITSCRKESLRQRSNPESSMKP